MNYLFLTLALSIAGISWGCGTQESAQCKSTTKSFSGCCSSHGGPKSCGTGQYYFQGGRLMCSDDQISPSCVE